jgi:hypothetical protein
MYVLWVKCLLTSSNICVIALFIRVWYCSGSGFKVIYMPAHVAVRRLHTPVTLSSFLHEQEMKQVKIYDADKQGGDHLFCVSVCVSH